MTKNFGKEIDIKSHLARFVRTLACGALLSVVMAASLPTASHAETGSVQVEFTKAALIVGFGAGRGILTLRHQNYPFKISGISFGATFGASTNKMVGRALHLDTPGDIVGIYTTVGAGGALAGGAGSVQLQMQREWSSNCTASRLAWNCQPMWAVSRLRWSDARAGAIS